MSFVLIKLYKKCNLTKGVVFFFAAAEFYGHSGRIIWKRVGNTAQENRRNFPWYSAFTVLNSSNRWLFLAGNLPLKFLDCTFWGKIKYFFACATKQISPMSNGFCQHQEELVQNMSRNSIIFFQCTITNFFRISRLICWCRIAKTDWEKSILYISTP